MNVMNILFALFVCVVLGLWGEVSLANEAKLIDSDVKVAEQVIRETAEKAAIEALQAAADKAAKEKADAENAAKATAEAAAKTAAEVVVKDAVTKAAAEAAADCVQRHWQARAACLPVRAGTDNPVLPAAAPVPW